MGDCEQFCNTVPDCDAYVFVVNSGQCWTKRGAANAPRVPDEGKGLISGYCAEKRQAESCCFKKGPP